MRHLSHHLRRQAELATDRAIPPETLTFIRRVEIAERAMERDAGPIETARQTLIAAWQEFSDRHGEFAARHADWLADRADGAKAERLSVARADLIMSLDWLEECRLAMSQALRQAQQDAVQAAGQPAGAAA